MARYIDVDIAVREAINACNKLFRENGKFLTSIDAIDIADALDEIPAADVAAVRHGEWEWHTEQHGNPLCGMDEDFGYRCSECHMWADEWGVDNDVYEEPPTHLHYCPNCGAKMDGGKTKWQNT